MAGRLNPAIARALRKAADRVSPPPPREKATNRIVVDEALAAHRREHAMALMDDDCHGYLLIRLVADADDEMALIPELVMPADARVAVGELLGHLHEELVGPQDRS
jgi:hypothetical protein